MSNKIVSVSIIGLGGRGGEAYGRYMAFLADKFKITHICDINPVRLVWQTRKFFPMSKSYLEDGFLQPLNISSW